MDAEGIKKELEDVKSEIAEAKSAKDTARRVSLQARRDTLESIFLQLLTEKNLRLQQALSSAALAAAGKIIPSCNIHC